MAEGVENARGPDRRNKNAATQPSSEAGHGSEKRRMYPLFFKLRVLKSFREDSDCKGNQRATARKYGIHRRQVQKWLLAEQSLRKSMGISQQDAIQISDERVGSSAEDTVLPTSDAEMPVAETISGSPLGRDESTSSDGITGSSSASSYSDDGPEPLDDGQPSLVFLLTVLNAFHESPEWHGREAATAQKFGIKRWQLRRWLKKEAEIRAEAAVCNRYCGEDFQATEYPRCDFSPDCTLPCHGGYDLSLRCSAAHLDRVVPHSTLHLSAQQVCEGERCSLAGFDGRFCITSPPTHYRGDDSGPDDKFRATSPPLTAPDGCLDFSMGKKQSDRDDVPQAKHEKDGAGACLQSVEMQVRVLDLRKVTEGNRPCSCDVQTSAPASVVHYRPWELPGCEADSCASVVPRWPTPLPPPAHTPWPVAVGEQRFGFTTAPPPAHCGQLYW